MNMTNGTTGNSSAPVMNIQKLKELSDSLRYEHDFIEAKLANYMIGEGFNPYKGCLLFLPIGMKSSLVIQPEFVKFFELAKTAILINPEMTGMRYMNRELFP